MARRVHVVPHTHWDREWYAPFPTFRARLVDLLDELLPRLDADPSLAHFLLDGQMAVVDDYLAVRPLAEATLRRLAASGRLAMGPWYVLMDEFLVSGETMVRDLQLGIERAAAFGGAMDVGYLPDMFGHVAQMPQLLRQAGFDHTVVWRGVPAAVDRSAFWWEAPDGSTVRAEYLPRGYGNGAALPDDAKELVGLVHEFAARYADLLGDDPILWMNGTDHQRPAPHLGRVLAEANALQDDLELAVVPLAEHVRSGPTEGLPTWRGELRSGARANLLMGVASNRVDVKIAAARAERELERRAEPLGVMAGVGGPGWLTAPTTGAPGSTPPDPSAALLAEAWLQVVRNAAHDSVCACSHDEVVAAVLHRSAEAFRTAEAVAARELRVLGASVAHRGALVVNPSARARGGIVELELPGTGGGAGLQVLTEDPGHDLVRRVPRADAPTVVEREIEVRFPVTSVEIAAADDGTLDVTITSGSPTRVWTGGAARRHLEALAAADPDGEVRVWARREPSRSVLAHVGEVPGFGWTPWEPGPLTVDPVVVGDDQRSLSNGRVTVRVDPDDATFAIGGLTGLGRLVDGGDAGDTYNWCPADADVVVDRPDEVAVTVVERGPLRARLEVTAHYRWPERVVADARVGERPVEVRTTLEVRAGDELVRVTTRFDNQSRDHRLRAWFPLPALATRSRAECAFAVVERGLTAEGGPSETGVPTFPSRRFVAAGGLTVVHEGLLEYELVDVVDGAARALALTLVRSTGMISRPPMPTRPLPAGPHLPVEGAQLLGNRELRYALHVADPDRPAPDPYALVDEAFLPLLVTRSGGDGPRPATGTALEVDGAEVSALRRVGDRVELRVFNPSSEAPTVVRLPGRTGWRVDLRGRPVAPFEGEVALGPAEIATLTWPLG
ncbi:MAG TPA: hypothetical protein VK866_06790 [Acidimicrobiales bacterium]|nr:hypothetical protein [Acidimicrobiales bacterium]